ncbi:Nucleotide-binding universal stress protein, UspA family [Raineyella antarctica]|uniref:Nucleotide-binding universal stress protein, UspA family n=1 Tax=Raineyella antarctica TaxID=1577474 RepID=A0A1G6HFZ1_9ACTN|nr:universal stress protein [Raineyella antarctica]SDB93084.1 Nucleotide-binding universal stress protein, UspA family [Raineyella antarctica]
MSDIVVCCTDGSELSLRAIEAGLALVDRTRLRPLLVSIVPEPPVATPVGIAADALTLSTVPIEGMILAQADALDEAHRVVAVAAERFGVPEEDTRVELGEVTSYVTALLEQTGAALVVVGSRGLGAGARFVLGSVSDHLVRHAPCPVLVGGDEVPTTPDGPVVLCLDDSQRSVHAAASALGVLDPSLPVAVATVTRPAVQGLPDDGLAQLQENKRLMDADELLGRAAGELGRPEAEHILLDGADPAEALLELAGSRPVRVLVVGTHGRNLVTRAVLGSVADQLVRRSTSLVCVVPPAED